MIIDESSVRTWLNLIRQFLEIYEWLGNAFVLDHFVDSHWDKLLSCWKTYLTNLSAPQLGEWILKGQVKQHGIPPPLGLQCFRKVTQILSLDRTFQSPWDKIRDLKSSHTVLNPETMVDPVVEVKKLKLLNRHVKPKKQHEIAHLSALIQELSLKSGSINNLIDVGAGVGHLCRTMSYGLGFNTIGIDSNSKLAISAKLFNEEIDKRMKNSLDQERQKPSSEHMNKFLTPHDKIHNTTNTKFGINGLHGCGDLGGIVIQNFVNNEEIRFLSFVSCCYMKMNECFPLSAFLKENPLPLSYEALELACHAKELYVDRLKDSEHINKLKVHCFRAVLETLLVPKGFIRVGLKSVKNTHLLHFRDYAIEATERIDVRLSDAELESESISKMLSQNILVIIFYTLRVILAPVIESVVLLDRALFIKENGIHTEIKAIFNPLLSPRNLVIIGLKAD